MYVRMYDELKKSKEDKPTIGILLYSETNVNIAKYSIYDNKFAKRWVE